MAFQKGQSGNPNGRPKGAENKATADIKAFASGVFFSPEWQESAIQRMKEGKAPHLETYLLQMLAGKPKESMEVTGDGGPLKVIFAGRYKPQDQDGDSTGH